MMLLDTSAVIEILSGTRKGADIKEFCENQQLFLSAITNYELLLGAGKQQKEIQEFIDATTSLAFDKRVAEEAAALERSLHSKGRPIGKLDTFIAATARMHSMTLLTTDKGFTRVPHLKSVIL